MIRTASHDDLPALRALFARANDAPYDLAAVAEEKCFGLGIAGEPVVRVHGGIDGAAVTCGRYLRVLIVDRAARRRGIGSALLADAQSRGAEVIAAEPGNYFTPGVLDTDHGSRAFLHARGYVETRWTYNLSVILSRGDGEGSPAETKRPRRMQGVLRRATPAQDDTGAVRRPTHADRDRVLAFIERGFGRIWRFEAAKAFERDEPTLFITEQDGEVTGFAAHDANNRGLGFFGPTGVAKSLRGRGLGCALLLASLADLHRLGYLRAVIPWTDALDFYRKCSGAEAAHRFVEYERRR